jgi:hypothetical protein
MYKGHFADEKIHGNGTYYFCDGGMYQGEWREDRQHGTGTLTLGTKGRVVAGLEWVKPGDVYHGPWVNHSMHGIGQWTHAKDGMTERIQCRNGELIDWPDRT